MSTNLSSQKKVPPGTLNFQLSTFNLQLILRQPPLPSPVVLDVAIALLFADLGKTQVELLHILIALELVNSVVQHHLAVLHYIAVISNG